MTSESQEAQPDRAPRVGRLRRLRKQLLGISLFSGDIRPVRVPLFTLGRGRGCLPFPHPWNYTEPLRILGSFFWKAEAGQGSGRHNRYLDVPGFAPIFVTRDPRVIRAISSDTGDKPGQFDRDTLPSQGIARATGQDSLLYANGSHWKAQKKLATPPFARTTLFQPEQFHEFERTFRHTVGERLEIVRTRIEQEGGGSLRVALEPEIKAIMLEMLANNFFGAEIPYARIRDHYVPSLENVIDHIVRDTVVNKLGIPLGRMPSFTGNIARAKRSQAVFEELVDVVIAGRRGSKGNWCQFRSDAPDDALRSNIRVFLAGALEATTSYAAWAISHLSRSPAAQEKLLAEIADIDDYTPETLARAKYLGHVLDETLRLTPALYFHPRRAAVDTRITTTSGETLVIPAGTHIMLDVWHANRHEDHWGVAATGFPALEFVPERWEALAAQERGDFLHFGFGHGPRFCPGKNLGQLEVALVVGACVKLFELRAVNAETGVKAGVSTKPGDGVLTDLRLRPPTSRPSGGADSQARRAEPQPAPAASKCPYSGGARPT